MNRFRDEIAIHRNRDRGENYKHGQFESDSEDDAVEKKEGALSQVFNIFNQAPKDAYGNSDIQTLDEYVNNVNK